MGLVPGFGDQGTLFFPQEKAWEPATEAVAAGGKGEIVAALPAVKFGQQGLVHLGADGSLAHGSAAVPRPGAQALAVDSQGRVVVSIGLEQKLVVARFLPDGSPDRSFGADGTASIAIPGYVGHLEARQATVLAVDRLDRVLVARLKTSRTSFRHGTGFIVARLTATGEPDLSFGISGLLTAKIEHSTPFSLTNLHVDPASGRVTVLATTFSHLDAEGSPQLKRFELVRILPNGFFDSNFGRQGFVRLAVGRLGTRAAAMAVDTRGRLVVGGTNGRGFGFARFLPDGRLDPAFGRGGRLVLPAPSAASTQLGALATDSRDRILVAANAGFRDLSPRGMVGFRLGSTGRLDRSFGRSGFCAASFARWSTVPTAILPQRHGTAIVAGLASRPAPGYYPPTAPRLRALALAQCEGAG